MKRADKPGVRTAPRELSDWFTSVAALTSDAFGMGEDPRGKAAVLHLLRRQAARLMRSPLDSAGESYAPLCFFLVAASRALGVRLQPSHWAAALHNLERQEAIPGGEDLGLALGTPAQRFKTFLDDALDNAGLGGRESVLDEEDRRLALGLAVNWGLRTLLAYSAEVKQPTRAAGSGRRDLAWMGNLVRHVCAPVRHERSRT